MKHIKSFNDTNKALQELEITLNKLNKNLGIIAAVQTSKVVFKDNDTSLMTSAAIADKIESYNYLTSTLSDEQVQDKVGAMFSGNTETLITATYQDADGTIDLTVDNDLSNYNNSSSGFTTNIGDITGVTITTDSGGGSKAQQTSDRADFSILGSNGVGVTNSSETITVTAVPGEIDHDSLNNWSSNKHIDWTSASAGTIDASNYTNTTYSVMASGNSYAAGLVAAGSGTHGSEFLRKDGTWVVPTNTTYSVGDGGLTTNDFTNDDHTKLNGISASADVTDATTVTAAGALMDTEVTNLSQVKAFDSSDYATAAQGSKADSAQQPPTEGAFANGDKTKLDGIAAGAQVNVSGNSGNAAIYDNSGDAALKTGITGAEVRAAIGAGTSNLALGTSGSTALAGNTALLQIGTSGSTAMAGNTAVGDSNVKSNWNESDSNSDAFIQNKPNVQYTSAISTGNNGLVPSAGSDGEFLKHDGTFGTPSYIANTDTDVSISNLESRLGQLDNTTIYIGSDQNRNLQPRGETNFGHAASFVNEPADVYASSTHYVQWDQGNKYNLTLQSANINFLSHPIGACNLLLKLTQPASGSTFTSITWTLDGSDTLLWPGGTNPTLSSANGAVDILSFYFDGTSKYYGVASLNFS